MGAPFSEDGVNLSLQLFETLTFVDIRCRTVDLKRIVTFPKHHGNTRIALHIVERLVEELIRQIQRFIIDNELHADNARIRLGIPARRREDERGDLLEQILHFLRHNRHGISFPR